MARTASIDKKRADRKAGTADRKAGRGRAKREHPLGAAIGFGLAAILITGIIFALVLVLIPGKPAHDFWALASNIHSATLPLDPLYQEWLGKIEEEDALLVTPASMLCGGLTLGWLAPSYAPRRRVLISGTALGFGVISVAVAFEWVAGLISQNTLNHMEGGQQVTIAAPPELIIKQIAVAVIWTAICVLGTGLGLRLRARQAR